MSPSVNLIPVICLVYAAGLFAIAFWAERRAALGRARWLHSPIVYTLSLSIYCSAWTFYGAVGYAARSGLEFVTIYLGPTLVFVGWWGILRKLVRIGRRERVTSIADLIAARYGKSNLLGVLVTVIGVSAATPYIALQLQSVTLSFGVFAGQGAGGWSLPDQRSLAFWVAAGLALFTILFGTRKLDANERHHGVVTAIAVEAAVKLVALLSVGSFAVWGIADGWSDVLERITRSPFADWHLVPERWIGITCVSAAAVLTLPRMFQVMVVENVEERHLAVASWAFPLYLLGMSLFVLPIAAIGLADLPAGSNPDLFVLTLPLAHGRTVLAALAFLGGFSSATSMVIVATIALATMVSNHIALPLWLAMRPGDQRGGDVRGVVILARRFCIAGFLALGYLYYRHSGGSAALAAIGLIAFVGAAQVLPAMIGGLYWRGATASGAALGLAVGYAVWLYCLFLPSLGVDAVMSASLVRDGPWSISWLRPQALFGLGGADPLLHALFWSLSLNCLAYLCGSLLTFPSAVERIQGLAFVRVFESDRAAHGWSRRSDAEAEDMLVLAQSILGRDEALGFFASAAAVQGKSGPLPDMSGDFLQVLERRLAGAIGSASAHMLIARLAEGAVVTTGDLMEVASDARQILEYSAEIEAKSAELTRTARALAEANEKLTDLSAHKDAFLGQISHELRTPMTSIRAFSEILADPDLPGELRRRYSEVIHAESVRLSRLLDDLLDLSVLESRKVRLHWQAGNLHDLIERAVEATTSVNADRPITISRAPATEFHPVITDTDRLVQVFINLIANARKYCDAAAPELVISVRRRGGRLVIEFTDNGTGIPPTERELVFEKFARLGGKGRAGGAGLGLAICREIMANIGGAVVYLPGQGGAAFRVTLPVRPPRGVTVAPPVAAVHGSTLL